MNRPYFIKYLNNESINDITARHYVKELDKFGNKGIYNKYLPNGVNSIYSVNSLKDLDTIYAQIVGVTSNGAYVRSGLNHYKKFINSLNKSTVLTGNANSFYTVFPRFMATPNAFSYLNSFPFNPAETFNGDKKSKLQLRKLSDYLLPIKQSLSVGNNIGNIPNWDLSLADLISDTEVWFVTKEEADTQIPVYNRFSKSVDNIQIPCFIERLPNINTIQIHDLVVYNNISELHKIISKYYSLISNQRALRNFLRHNRMIEAKIETLKRRLLSELSENGEFELAKFQEIEEIEKELNKIEEELEKIETEHECLENEHKKEKEQSLRMKLLFLKEIMRHIEMLKERLSELRENILEIEKEQEKIETELERLKNKNREIENEIRSKNKIIDPLGCYFPETGTILIWIDKIHNRTNSQVVFQKVLLHEFIHALLDLQPRDKSGNLIGQHIAAVAGNNWETGWTEETLDNALVLQCYKGTKYYEVIRSFIKHQPADYALALKVTDKELTNNLRSLILEKIK